MEEMKTVTRLNYGFFLAEFRSYGATRSAARRLARDMAIVHERTSMAEWEWLGRRMQGWEWEFA